MKQTGNVAVCHRRSTEEEILKILLSSGHAETVVPFNLRGQFPVDVKAKPNPFSLPSFYVCYSVLLSEMLFATSIALFVGVLAGSFYYPQMAFNPKQLKDKVVVVTGISNLTMMPNLSNLTYVVLRCIDCNW